jgi:hypothetical protein
MKNGTVYEGKIIKESMTTITILNKSRKREVIQIDKIENQKNDKGEVIINNMPDNSELFYPEEKEKQLITGKRDVLKFYAIDTEINTVDQKMKDSTFAIFAGPVIAGLGISVLNYVKEPANPDNVKTTDAVNIIIAATGGIISMVGLLQYWDGVNTIAQLKAKKYDLMMNPFFKTENFTSNCIGTFGLAITIKI